MTFGNFPFDATSPFIFYNFLNAIFTCISFYSEVVCFFYPCVCACVFSTRPMLHLFGHANELNANSLPASFWKRQLSLLYHFVFSLLMRPIFVFFQIFPLFLFRFTPCIFQASEPTRQQRWFFRLSLSPLHKPILFYFKFFLFQYGM